MQDVGHLDRRANPRGLARLTPRQITVLAPAEVLGTVDSLFHIAKADGR
jgi:hypothetical protein